jgi:hypothetical protein
VTGNAANARATTIATRILFLKNVFIIVSLLLGYDVILGYASYTDMVGM